MDQDHSWPMLEVYNKSYDNGNSNDDVLRYWQISLYIQTIFVDLWHQLFASIVIFTGLHRNLNVLIIRDEYLARRDFNVMCSISYNWWGNFSRKFERYYMIRFQLEISSSVFQSIIILYITRFDFVLKMKILKIIFVELDFESGIDFINCMKTLKWNFDKSIFHDKCELNV